MEQIDALFSGYGEATPGCAVTVLDGDEVIVCTYGTADLERGVPITAGTRFNLGSSSKQFTALALLLLAEEGRLGLDDDVRVHLPEMPDTGETITLRHLLHHTSGLRDTYPDLLLLAGWRFTDLITQDDCLRLIRAQQGLSFPPGSEHLYVNANYVLLAEVVARASGAAFGAFLRERIFEPLGMADTLVMDDVFEVMPRRALGYYLDEGSGVWHNLPLTDAVLGSTNVYSTGADLARWLANLRDHDIGGEAVWEAMLTPGSLADGTPLSYAGGLEVSGRHRGRRYVEHGGQHGGYCTSVLWFPDGGPAASIVFNHYLWDTRERLLAVADLFLEASEAEPPATAVEERRIEADPARLEALAGTYYDEGRAAVRQVPLVDGALRYTGLALVPIGPDRFTFAEEPAVEVLFDDESVTTITPGGTYRYDRVPPSDPAAVAAGDYTGRYDSAELGVSWRIVVDDGGLVVHRHRHPDTRLTPVTTDAFSDDWSPVAGFPMEFLVVFERGAGSGVTGLRVSGQRARGIRFERAG